MGTYILQDWGPLQQLNRQEEVISESNKGIKRTGRVSLAYQCFQVYNFLQSHPSTCCKSGIITPGIFLHQPFYQSISDWCSQDAAIHFSTAKTNSAVGRASFPRHSLLPSAPYPTNPFFGRALSRSPFPWPQWLLVLLLSLFLKLSILQQR